MRARQDSSFYFSLDTCLHIKKITQKCGWKGSRSFYCKTGQESRKMANRTFETQWDWEFLNPKGRHCSNSCQSACTWRAAPHGVHLVAPPLETLGVFPRGSLTTASHLSLSSSASAGREKMWSDILRHPVWALSTALLALVVRLQRRARWDPRTCAAQLRGKTAIVTGANTGLTLRNRCTYSRITH